MTNNLRARIALGIATGTVLSYTLMRTRDAFADRRSPLPQRSRDAASYGEARRTLMLAGIARSAANLAVWSFVIAPAAERALQRVPKNVRLPVFVAAMSVLDTARDWPVDYVEEFMLERIYATSDRTAFAWATDRVKGLAVGTCISALVAFAAGAMMRRAPRRWPFIAIAALPPLFALANVIAPTFIMPLFNRYVPLEGELEMKIRALATRYGVGNANILRFDMSRQTKKANAFVTGVLGTERIALADTLVNEFAADETLFVVAHELGHYVRRDPWWSIALGTALTGTTLLAAVAAAKRTGSGEGDGVAGTIQIAFYATLGGYLTMPLANAVSRALERRADRFAVAATSDPAGGARAFRRLREQNLAEDEGPKWAEFIFSSHPSLKSRIARLEATVPQS